LRQIVDHAVLEDDLSHDVKHLTNRSNSRCRLFDYSIGDGAPTQRAHLFRSQLNRMQLLRFLAHLRSAGSQGTGPAGRRRIHSEKPSCFSTRFP
jgi:hypothetical protein